MAVALLSLIILTISVRLVAAQQTNGPVPFGASLTATPDAKPWLSPSGEFAFGFQQVQVDENFLLSVWYDKIPDKTIVWYPKDGPMVPRGSKVELNGRSGLVLSDPQGREVWSSGTASDLAYGIMNDTGNFVIVGNNSRKIWESFNFPSDTLLPTQVMAAGGVMNSKISSTNFSGGRFQFQMLQNGDLVLNTRDIPSNTPYVAYYFSDTVDPYNSTNSGKQVIFDAAGYLYILRRNGRRVDLNPRGSLPSGEYYHRATLDSDGIFTQYSYPKNPTRNTSWGAIWFVPNNICESILYDKGSGACGFNSICSLNGNQRNCECPKGYSLLDPNDPNDPNGDCKPAFSLSCDDDYRKDLDFIELTNVDWPLSDYVFMNQTNEQSCKSSCLEDCFCAVAIYRDNKCYKKKLPLSNGKKDTALNMKAFLKFQKGNQSHEGPSRFPVESKSQRSLIYVGPVLLTTSILVIFILITVIFVGIYLIICKKKSTSHYPSSEAAEITTLRRFTYQELAGATNGFRDELGRGAFAVVYKGIIGTDIVAVKRLDRMFQDNEKEFQAEVNAIGRTHHKNLVQLLGYCDDGEQRLLVYEYMSNGSLSELLFGDMRASWKQRSSIAVGIAKGLSYLHEDCSTQVIHCDIKPQNILLDDYYNAKISDFGLAKLLMMDQSRTSTGIRGTKGYVAPEWFRNSPVTVKVDVYSFGVLLLEIVSCRKSLDFRSGNEERAVLSDWAWDCYVEGRLDTFVGDDVEALEDYKRLTRFVMVGLWCVQENPSLRPSMRSVIQMLEGVVEVMKPPSPYPFSN